MSFFGRSSSSLGVVSGQVSLDATLARKGADEAVRALQRIADAAERTNRSLENANGGINRIGDAIGAVGKAISVTAGVVGLEQLTQKTIGLTAELEQASAAVRSIRPDLALEPVFESLNRLQSEIPVSLQDLGEGLYQIFSSLNIPLGNAVDLLDKLGRGAIGARTSTEIFGTAVIGIMNAFGKTVDDVDHIMDVFFNTVNKGVVTGPELARNLGLVTQSGKLFGATWDEIGAAIAAVTRAGGPAFQNINNLHNLFQKLVQPKTIEKIEDLGISVNDAGGRVKQFLPLMRELKAKFDQIGAPGSLARAEAISKTFTDMQARSAFLTLLDQLDFLDEVLNLNVHSAGSAAEAFNIMNETLNAQIQMAKNLGKTLAINLGKGALAPLAGSVKRLNDFMRNALATQQDWGAAFGQIGGKLIGVNTDVLLFEGVMNRLFGVESGVTRGVRGFADAFSWLRDQTLENLGRFAALIEGMDGPLGRFIAGVASLVHTGLSQIFPTFPKNIAGNWTDATTAIANSLEQSLTPMQRFQRLLGQIAQSPVAQSFRGVVAQLLALQKPALDLAKAWGELETVFLKPLLGGLKGSDLQAIAGGLLAIRNPASAAFFVLSQIQGTLDGLAGLLNAAGTAMDNAAAGLRIIGARVDASGVIQGIADALGRIFEKAGPVIGLLKDLGSTIGDLLGFGRTQTDAALYDPTGPIATAMKRNMPLIDLLSASLIDLLGKIKAGLEGVPELMDRAGAGLGSIAGGLAAVATRVDTAGLLADIVTNLRELALAVPPALGQLLQFGRFVAGTAMKDNTLGGFDIQKQLTGPLQDTQGEAQNAATILVQILSKISSAASGATGGLRDFTGFLADFQKELEQTQNLSRLIDSFSNLGRALDAMASAFSSLGTAVGYFISVQQGKDLFGPFPKEQEARNLARFMGNLAIAIDSTASSLNNFADAVNRVGPGIIEFVQHMNQAQLLWESKDPAGAIAEVAKAWGALGRSLLFSTDQQKSLEAEGKRLDILNDIKESISDITRTRIALSLNLGLGNSEEVLAKIREIQSRVELFRQRAEKDPSLKIRFPTFETDAAAAIDALTGKLKDARDKSLDLLAVYDQKHTIVIDTNTAAAKADLIYLQGLLASIPYTFTVRGYIDTSNIEPEIKRIGNLLPHSPAKEGPLKQVPDWSYIIANLPQVMGTMVDIVKKAGEKIGAEKQVEQFNKLADAVASAARAIGETIDASAKIDNFLAPNLGSLDEIASVIDAVLERLRRLGTRFGEKDNNSISSVAQAASSAMSALGAALDTLAKSETGTVGDMTAIDAVLVLTEQVLERLGGLAGGFDSGQLREIETVSAAMTAAFQALGAAFEPMQQLSKFRGVNDTQAAAAIDTIGGILGHMDDLASGFARARLARLKNIGEVVKVAFDGLAAALAPLDQLRKFVGVDPGTITGLMDEVTGILVRFDEMSKAFGPRDIPRMKAVGEAAAAAFQALQVALEPMRDIRRFVRVPEGRLQDVLDGMTGFLVRFNDMSKALQDGEPEHVKQTGEAAAAAFGALSAALDSLNRLGDVRPIDQRGLERAFEGLSGVAVRMRDLSKIWTEDDTPAKAKDTADAIEASFGALAAALETLPKLADFRAPKLGAALDDLVTSLRQVVLAIAQAGEGLGEATGTAKTFADDASSVVGLISDAVAAFEALPRMGKVSQQNLDDFGSNLRLAVRELVAVTADIGPILSKEAVQFAKDVGDAMGVFSAVAAFKDLATFVPPSRGQIRAFFAVVQEAVALLAAEAQRIKPEISKQMAQVGKDLSDAFGGAGAAAGFFGQLNELEFDKRFRQKLLTMFAFVRETLGQMQQLSAQFRDLGAVDALAGVLNNVGQALSTLVGVFNADVDPKKLEGFAKVLSALQPIVATPITITYNYNITVSGRIDVVASGFPQGTGDANGQVAAKISDDLSAGILDFLTDAFARRTG